MLHEQHAGQVHRSGLCGRGLKQGVDAVTSYYPLIGTAWMLRDQLPYLVKFRMKRLACLSYERAYTVPENNWLGL